MMHILVAWLLVAAGTTQSAAETVALENSIGMRFVRIPAGQFAMGNDLPPERMRQLFPEYPAARLDELGDEAPAHAIRISRDFWLGQHEVTVGQFRAFVEQSGYVPESVRDGSGGYGFDARHDADRSPAHDAFAGRDPRFSWLNTGFAQTEAHPVVNVTWNDAMALARWLSDREGRRYRLPSEAEWEYACSGGQSLLYPNGDAPALLDRTANVFDASSASLWPHWSAYARPATDGFPFTAPVGSFEPNALGLYDMAGNVWEWTADWYDEKYYQHSPPVDPPGPERGTVRVRRGGSWHTWPLYARCSFRNVNSPETRYVLQGMRLLLEQP